LSRILGNAYSFVHFSVQNISHLKSCRHPKHRRPYCVMVTTSPLLAMSRNGYDAHIRESLNLKWRSGVLNL